MSQTTYKIIGEIIMGMFSEIHATLEADKLGTALLKAIEINQPQVTDYCRENILPLYEHAVGESWSTEESDHYQRIKQFFNP